MRKLLVLLVLLCGLAVVPTASAQYECPTSYVQQDGCQRAVNYAWNWQKYNCFTAVCYSYAYMQESDAQRHWYCFHNADWTNPDLKARCYLYNWYNGGYSFRSSYFNVKLKWNSSQGTAYMNTNCPLIEAGPLTSQFPTGQSWYWVPGSSTVASCYLLDRYIP